MTDNSSSVVILITLLNILVYKLQKLKEAQQTNRLPLSVRQLCRRFSLQEIQLATDNFQQELVIGKGGFGMVYKGIIDLGQRIVAIKRLKSTSTQGRKEFQTEIEMLSQFRHSHLVPLIGYCDESEEMILVYEYMPSGNLADHLHKRVNKGDMSLPPLSWVQRLKICVGAAHGLDYLHTGTSIKSRVIHRDVKTTNILLDENLEARISDFGLSKTGPANQTCTHVSTRVKGTPGYLDPYYISTHRLTRKSDVYAFGVVLLEVLCGRRAVDRSLDDEQINIVGWAQHCFKEGLLDQITEPNIKGVISSDALRVYMDTAIKCLHYQPKHRPTMAEVVVGLESALTLQRKSTQYPLVEMMPIHCTEIVDCSIPEAKDNNHSQECEIMPIHCTEIVDCSIPEAKDNNHSQECEHTGEGIINVSNGWHHKKQSSVGMTFRKRISGLLSVKAWAFAVKSMKLKADNRASFLPVTPLVRQEPLDQEKVLHSSNLKSFTFNELSVATRKFHPDSVVKEDAYGVVFMGWVDANTFAAAKWGTGQAIAVKRLVHEGRGDWLAEINYLGNLCHPNVVRLIGYCLGEDNRFLVYDYLPQTSLKEHLIKMKGGRLLDWPTRYNIIDGIARGILYLHRDSKPTVMHRNLNASNILLDHEMNPRISYFGGAKILGESESEMSTMRVVGTYGYMSPEYLIHGKFSVKSDVYSFGVLVLEIVSGRENTSFRQLDPDFLAGHVWGLYLKESCLELFDEATIGSCNQSELSRAIQVGLLCVQEYPKDRPSMAMVISMLSGGIELPQPKRPAYFREELDSQISSPSTNKYSEISSPTTSLLTPR
ncbi:hypothetical protein ACET3Z_032548 [Daucus carota]